MTPTDSGVMPAAMTCCIRASGVGCATASLASSKGNSSVGFMFLKSPAGPRLPILAPQVVIGSYFYRGISVILIEMIRRIF